MRKRSPIPDLCVYEVHRINNAAYFHVYVTHIHFRQDEQLHTIRWILPPVHSIVSFGHSAIAENELDSNASSLETESKNTRAKGEGQRKFLGI